MHSNYKTALTAVLVLAMCVSAIAIQSDFSDAADSTDSAVTESTKTVSVTIDGSTTENLTFMEAIDQIAVSDSKKGTVKLLEDTVEVTNSSESITIQGISVTIDLNGHNLDIQANTIKMPKNVDSKKPTLTLIGTDESGVEGSITGSSVRMFQLYSGNNMVLESGKLVPTGKYAVETKVGSNFTMNGGSIDVCLKAVTAGVYVTGTTGNEATKEFNMNGGTILVERGSDCISGSSGVLSKGYVSITGGSIICQSANNLDAGISCSSSTANITIGSAEEYPTISSIIPKGATFTVVGSMVLNVKEDGGVFGRGSVFSDECRFGSDCTSQLPGGYKLVSDGSVYRMEAISDSEVGATITASGETYSFLTLYDAVMNSKKGETITLKADYEGDTVMVDKKVTIDLNGFNVTVNGGVPAINVTEASTIKNSSTTASTITGEPSVQTSSTLTIDDGTSISCTLSLSGKGNIPYYEDVPERLVGGGYLSNKSGGDFVYLTAYWALQNDTDGTVELLGDSSEVLELTVKGKNSGKYTVDLNGHEVSVTNANPVNVAGSAADVTIRNGTISVKDTSSEKATAGVAVSKDDVNVKLVDVIIITDGDYGVATIGTNSNVNITIEGGSITNTSGWVAYLPADGNVTVTGSPVLTGVHGIQYCGTGTVTIDSGTIKATDMTSYGSPSKPASEKDGSVSDGAALSIISRNGYNDSVKLVINGGTFESAANPAVRSYLYGTNTSASVLESATITDGTFTSPAGTDAIAVDDSEFEKYAVSGGTFSSDVTGLCTDALMTVEENGVWVIADAVTISFSGITADPIKVQKGAVLSDTSVLPVPGTGYEYTWKVDGGVIDFSTYIFDTDTTLTAETVLATYTISFDANGGTGEMEGVQLTIESEYNAPENGFSLVGHAFAGWNTAADGSGTQYGVGASVTITGEMTLYAQWKANSYTISFNANGGEGSMEQMGMTYGVSAALTDCAFTRTGHTFTGWNTAVDGSGTPYSDGQTVSNLSSADDSTVTLYAQWKANTYTISFDANGGTGSMSAQDGTYGLSLSIDANSFTRAGYTFAGWNTSADGSGTSYSDRASLIVSGDITLRAQWTPVSYTVAFDANGGTGAMSPVDMTYDAPAVLTGCTFAYEGYVFAGWNTSADGSGTSYGDLAEVMNLSAEDGATVTLYAIWAAGSYTIAFDANGGTGEMSPLDMTYGVPAALTVGAYTRTGYTFAGWNTAADGSGVAYEDGQTVSNLASEDGATVTLYAQWSANTYTIAFDANGGDGLMEPMDLTYDVSVSLAVCTFVHEGYFFAGWNTSADGSGTSYGDLAEVVNLSAEDGATVILYAQWKADTYTVVFDANGGEGSMEPMDMTYDVTLPLVKDSFTRTGYSFTGWNTSADGSGTAYADGQDVSNLASEDGATVTLYAQWEANTYVIVFDPNGGAGSMGSVSMTYDVPAVLSENAFERTGYTFTGWNTSADGSGTAYADGQDVSNLASEDGATVTLYAQWKANAYTVSFDANGGAGSMDSMPMAYDVPAVLSENAFERTGCSFTGWNTAADGSGTSYGNLAEVMNLSAEDGATVVLYAQWERIVISDTEVEVDPDSGSVTETVTETVTNDDGSKVETTVTTVTDSEGNLLGTTSSETVTSVKTEEGRTETTISTETVVTDADGNITGTTTESTVTAVTETEGSKVTETVTETIVEDADGNVSGTKVTVTETVTDTEESKVTVEESTASDGSVTKKVTEEAEVRVDGSTVTSETVIEVASDGSASVSQTITAESDDGSVRSVLTQTDGASKVVTTVPVADDGRIGDDVIATAIAQSGAVSERVVGDEPGKAIEVASDAAAAKVIMSPESMGAVSEAGFGITIVCEVGTMDLDHRVVATLSAPAMEVTITMSEADDGDLTPAQAEAKGDCFAVSMTAVVGDEQYHELGGTVTVTIPYLISMGSDPEKLGVFHIDDDGERKSMGSVYDRGLDAFVFETPHFSIFVVDLLEQPADEPVIPPFITDEDDPVIIPPVPVVPSGGSDTAEASDDNTTEILACAAAVAFAVLLALLAVSIRRS